MVISTATKSLQEQLFNKDVPFLQKYFAPNLKVALMKGRNNFLCRQKVHQIEGQALLKGIDEVDWFAQIRDWEKLTETGDRSELTFLPDDAELWHRIDARSDLCTGQKCPEFERCFLTAMKQRAQEADLIIVNHHLFFADLAIRQDDFGSILPEYSAVVFDEAHEIEDVASDYFGRRVSSYRFEELVRDTEAMLRLLKIEAAPLRKHLMRVRERARTFFEHFPEREGRFPFGPAERKSFLEQQSRSVRRTVRRGEAHRDGTFRDESQAGGSGDARAARRGTAPRIRVPAGKRRKKLRLLVRTARQGHRADGDADRRERNSCAKNFSSSSIRWC